MPRRVSPPAQRIAVVSSIRDDAKRPLLRPRAASAGHGNPGKRRDSASFTSAGLAEVSGLPKGMPTPSTTAIYFVPLPRLALPTPKPLLSGSKAPVRKVLAPVELTLLVELAQKGAPDFKPHAALYFPIPVGLGK